MKCFIASAFGREDVDAVYDHCVNPVLRQLSITPLRVDRVEHNEDIDNKIFELLDASDLVIADLTYARPSVYYEAGYAVGNKKPVIYIARKDHFRAQFNDPEGLLRIHFDLQMKNIISWRNELDAEFSKQLLARLRFVLRPLFVASKKRDIMQTERMEFDRLSQNDKLRSIQRKARALLNVRSFKEVKEGKRSNFKQTLRNHVYPSLSSYLFRHSEPRNQYVCMFFTSSAIKSLFEALSHYYNNYFVKSSTETHYFIASLKSVPQSRITSSLPNFHFLDNFTLQSEYQSYRITDATIFIHIIDNIKSTSEFADMFRTVIQKNGLDKGA